MILPEKLFELSANKSIEELKDLYEIAKQALRYYISRQLMDYTENNPFKCYESLPSYDKGFFGLSELQKPHITSLYHTSDGSGYIMVHIEGEEDCELSDYSLDDQLFIANLLQNV